MSASAGRVAPSLASAIAAIRPLNTRNSVAIQQRIDSLTKPLGSLGALEPLMLRLALITADRKLSFERPHIVIFAADHGAAAAGVSAYPQAVTRQMVANYIAGGAAINVLARQTAARLVLVDAGVAGDAITHSLLTPAALRAGTSNYLVGPAMSIAEANAAIERGSALTQDLIERGADLLALGEMGIGNTASSSLLMHCLTPWSLRDCVGAGSGLDAAGVSRKLGLLDQALARGGRPSEPLLALAEYGGFETAMLCGAIVAAAARQVPVIIDGFTVSAAALLAAQLAPATRDYCIFAHRSAEVAHGRLLDSLSAQPLLELGVRLGEGSGAALAIPLCRAAAALLAEMATFESAQVSHATS